MTNKKDIGEIYREAFKDYTMDPSPRAWEIIEQHPSVSPPPQSWWMKPGNILLGVAGAGIIAASAYFLYPRDKEDSAESQEIVIEETTKPVENENIIVLEENNNAEAIEEATVTEERKAEKTLPATAVKKEPIVTIANDGEDAVFEPEVIIKTKPITKPAEIITSDTKQAGNIVIKSSEQQKTPEIQSKSIPTDNSQARPLLESPDDEFLISYSADKTICEGDEVRVGVSGGATYYWSTGDITDSIAIRPAVTSVYRVTVYNNDGYSKFGEIVVNVESCARLFVPNTFTPNFDGVNDVFKAVGTGFLDFRMIVTDKSGSMLFESTDIEIGWDGNYKGQPADVGSYFYVIYYTDGDKKLKIIKGRLMLFR